MKKVTMFVWNNFVNDARVLREASALADTGYKVTIIAKKELSEMHLLSSEKISEGVFVNRPLKLELSERITGRIKSSVITKHIPNMLLMFKMIMLGRKYDTDVYHAHDLNTLIQGIVSAKLRLNRKKLIYDSHEVQTSRTHYSFDKIYKIEKFLLNFTDAVIVENETRAHYHNDLYKELPAAVHNYSELYEIDEVEAFPLKAEYDIPEDKKVVLYQGGMQDGRGLFKLLEAFTETEGAVLFMIGDGKERQNLIKYHKELALEKKVIFIDRVPYKDLRRYTKAADIGIQFLENTNFNHYSASSNKLFEYIMAHVPVIGSKLPEIERVIEEEKVGLTVEEGNAGELAGALSRLINDDELRMEFKKNTSLAKQKYNWENEKEILTGLYTKL
ncbi:glycosyl transferase [Jeotgalicoccus coquinae]|uniref:D-inositol-3-phosphate glycosyltransferase n=1 Tax=Jeotgalicoccus coquinae TaxID=709509 RepID=A0A6V7RK93_9STAP|nr:glycosyltransferase family 4 protein [Jeotgalicoccus coquinae]MBB6422449.1 glycosyltransferase involved in cell wall biosynthesis [Jeotgalicoccus coquinae]GGE15763.1 glycosyl transferase [Jeotgalicoccus coquinae]CAD2078593.1 D-inositol-3-phosphate glycosyltransferase [Jeotgalicoccus coquinae]